MKHNIIFKISGWFAAASMLLTTACDQDTLYVSEYDDGDYATVSFTVQPEGFSAISRVSEDNGEGLVDYSNCHISDGTKAKMLIYAVYDSNGELLREFGQRERAVANGEEDKAIELPNGTILGEGQTYINVDKTGGKFPVKVELRLKRGETYKVAFWAQDPNCKFYDIDNLKSVKVHYAEIDSDNTSSTPNNDESRDAFCRVEELKIERKSDENRTIYLYRPLAQINVGTTGYDYETVVRDEKSKYAYSRIQIVSGARYLDVVNDRIGSDDKDNISALEYGWAKIPAYINYDKVPDKLYERQGKEEYLKVHLYTDDNSSSDDKYMPKDGDYCGYADLNNDGKLTETFKYLSMCYVLVPSGTSRDENGNVSYDPTTIERIRVWLATDADGTDAKEIVDVANVHAQRNWRTNILGDILTTNVNLKVVLDPIYAGDYNGFYEDGDVDWSGPLDYYGGGAYYDAENDEILISNANGLLWLQQMVNGDLVYNLSENGVKAGEAIKYYSEDHTEHSFAEGDPEYRPYFKGIKEPTKDPDYDGSIGSAKVLRERILKATHQDKNNGFSENYTWPERNNFHFVGKNGPAKVKLVADIDMSGIDWLGIGFDCKMDQTGDMLADSQGDRNSLETGNNKVYDAKQHRGFFGHFNGNGHTISNLRTKRFSMDVHPSSYQASSGGPYDGAVQWYARGFFGQLGGEAVVENLTLSNVDIYGFHCVGGIAGAAIGVDHIKGEGKNIIIRNCVVDGGTIENVPMYRGDIKNGSPAKEKDRTWARGVNTGGIVGLYNAGGSVDGNRVSNLTIKGYRIVGGIVGCVDHYYLAYLLNKDYGNRRSEANNTSVKPQSVSNNNINNTIIIGDHFKPFSSLQHKNNFTDGSYTTDWAYGFSWGTIYDTYADRLVGGPNGNSNVTNCSGNNVDGDDVQLINLSGEYKLTGNKIEGRTTDLDNVPIEDLPVFDNWFVDYVYFKSNLIGAAKSYKRYQTIDFNFYSFTPSQKLKSPFNMFTSYDHLWDTESGLVGLYAGAITLDGENHILSVREATGENDCAMLITSCDRTQFTGNSDNSWYTSASTIVKDLTVRGNTFAYTGISLAPTSCMNEISISGVSVYDVYQTLALANLSDDAGNVWPHKVSPQNVSLKVNDSNLRGYTIPGAGWNSISYTEVIFEKGSNAVIDDETTYTCKVEANTTFSDCTFKAPFIIDIASGGSATFSGCKATFDGANETAISVPEAGCKKIIIDKTGTITYE